MDLSVIVASYNTGPLLRQCLESLGAALSPLETEVLVVDNRSTDGSQAMVERDFRWVTLIRNGRNTGFARANNTALELSSGRYVLLLNPDTLVPSGTLGPMVEFLDSNPEVGMAGCRLERPDGVLDEACKRSFPTPWSSLARFLALDRLFPRSRTLGSYRCTWRDPRGRYEVDSVVGAFMLCRRRVLEEVGGLDEDYFMFGEDLDWCYRIKSSRWKVFYLGDRRVIHHKGAATAQAPHRMNFHFHRSMFLFHRKHLEVRYPFFVNWLVYSGIGLRYAFKSITTLLGRVGSRNPQALPQAAGAVRPGSGTGAREGASAAEAARGEEA